MMSWLRRSRAHPVPDEELSALADGRLEARRRAAVEAHVSVCDACHAQVAELKALKAMLAAVPATVAPRSFALSAAVLRQAQDERPRVAQDKRGAATRGSGRPATPLWAPALAFTVLVLLLGVDAFDNGAGSSSRSSADTALSTQKTAAGSAESSFSNAAPAPVQPRAADSAQAPPSSTPQAAAGAAAQTAPSAAADAARSSAATPAAPPLQQVHTPEPKGNSVPALRVLEIVSAALLAVSLVWVWRRRSTA
jgi:hypothetical protein